MSYSHTYTVVVVVVGLAIKIKRMIISKLTPLSLSYLDRKVYNYYACKDIGEFHIKL